MALFTLGINHRTAPLAARERLAFHPEELPRALTDLASCGQAFEAAILSTCNRTELYFQADTPNPVGEWLIRYRKLDSATVMPCLYSLKEEETIRHVFRVACGLDSMVLGEPQVLGQMKSAERIARGAGTLGPILSKLFHSAFFVAKDVRSKTAIGANIVSMAAAAVRLAEDVFGQIEGLNVLFIGAGEMIDLCATHFSAKRPGRIVVANRTIDRGRAMAERFGATAIRLEELAERLAEFDIVVSCTASQLPILGLGMVERAMRARQSCPLFLTDLAVPRDIESEVSGLENVFLYTIDDLAKIVEAGVDSRQSAAADAGAIVAEHAENFLRWLRRRENVPVIRALRDSAERMRRHELERAMRRLTRGGDPAGVLEEMSHRMTNKFLHAPTQTLGRTQSSDLHAVVSHLFHLRP
ncbi:MAG: glutamyl-tRNA reductase [Candidatus Accumulibacter sp.]|jgi:glutamyl-tRNA reductase|nr:glutamyl-tRNA reductase [Accumulibacter sp.]